MNEYILRNSAIHMFHGPVGSGPAILGMMHGIPPSLPSLDETSLMTEDWCNGHLAHRPFHVGEGRKTILQVRIAIETIGLATACPDYSWNVADDFLLHQVFWIRSPGLGRLSRRGGPSSRCRCCLRCTSTLSLLRLCTLLSKVSDMAKRRSMDGKRSLKHDKDIQTGAIP